MGVLFFFLIITTVSDLSVFFNQPIDVNNQ